MHWLILSALFGALFAFAKAGSHPTECGVLQRGVVKHQWAQAYASGEDRTQFGFDMWTRIFKQHPELRTEYFSRVRGDNILSPEFRGHIARINGGFNTCIGLLHHKPELDVELKHLGVQHKNMTGITEAHFDVVRHAIMDTVQERIGHCFNYDAWNLCTKVITDGMFANMSA